MLPRVSRKASGEQIEALQAATLGADPQRARAVTVQRTNEIVIQAAWLAPICRHLI